MELKYSALPTEHTQKFRARPCECHKEGLKIYFKDPHTFSDFAFAFWILTFQKSQFHHTSEDRELTTATKREESYNHMTSRALDFRNTPNLFTWHCNWIDGNAIRTAENINRDINTRSDPTSYVALFCFKALMYQIRELLDSGGSSSPAMDIFIFTNPHFSCVLKD